jgi:hypothetical protein
LPLSARNLHRDLAYFYVGVLISFAFSGIFFNHRDSFDPKKYTSKETPIKSEIVPKEEVNDEYIKKLTSSLNVKDKLRRYSLKDKLVKVSYMDHELEIDISTGKGKLEEFNTIPVLGQMSMLHKANSQWWIYYSDVFGISVLTIAITGLFLAKGKASFQSRGWKLALLGVLFPLVFIFLLS